MIHRLPIPTPFAVGRVNCYLIEDEPLTLVDVGPNSGKSLDELERALAGARAPRRGPRADRPHPPAHRPHRPRRPARAALGRRGRRARPARAVARRLRRRRSSRTTSSRGADARHGIPRDVRLALRGVSRSFRGWGGSVNVTRPLRRRLGARVRDRTLHVLHRPGPLAVGHARPDDRERGDPRSAATT